jgi:predicted PurR-regulated permease PerM
MLLERRDLRDRLIRLFGLAQLDVTTRAFDEAGARVSRQLLMQALVSVIYGVAAGVGLYVLDVPYPLVWAALGAVLRFVPYVGPLLGAGAPILISLAAADGWVGPLWVVGLFVVLELFTNLVLETVLYAGAAGISSVALLLSVAFWTWLWGPLGLLIATPLTVCVVVLGKHVPGLEFVGTLMAHGPVIADEAAPDRSSPS